LIYLLTASDFTKPFEFQERLRQRDLKVHEKTTYASKVNFKTAQMIKPSDSDEEKEEGDTDKAVAVKDDPQFTIAVTRGLSKSFFLCICFYFVISYLHLIIAVGVKSQYLCLCLYAVITHCIAVTL